MNLLLNSKYFLILFYLVFLVPFFSTSQANTKNGTIKIGTYYFNGWTEKTKGTLTKSLVDTFYEREPKWGWYNNRKNIMENEISLAANAGISFFSFDWYYANEKGDTVHTSPLNNGLDLYLNAKNRTRLKFSLLVVNHSGFIIGPNDWQKVSEEWIPLFKNPLYLTVSGKPYLSFFTLGTLVKSFGSEAAVKQALDSLRILAKKQGLTGVTIGICVPPNQISQAQKCGFDILTAYNYPDVGFQKGKIEVPIDSLISNSTRIWNEFKSSLLPYIPAATLNWDPRPWAPPGSSNSKSQRYIGFSPKSVYKSVKALKGWINENPHKTVKEKIGLLYAWNEYGEGAWLTPTKKGVNMLKGVKKALAER